MKTNLQLEYLLIYQKAFDTVNYDIPLTKLKHYEVNIITNLKLFKSYFSSRKQFISSKRQQSKNITCSVPQGSILGPLLFYYMLMTYTKLLVYYNLYCARHQLVLFT